MLENIKDYIRAQFRLRDNGPAQIILCNVIALLLFVAIKFFVHLLGHDGIYDYLVNAIALPSKWAVYTSKPWTILTYNFVQVALFSAAFDFLLLHSFGRIAVSLIGNKNFLRLHFLGIVGGGCMVLLFYNLVPSYKGVFTLLYGLDGSIYATIASLAVLAPNTPMMLILFGRVRLKHVALFFLMTSLFSIDAGNALGVCQLGGMLAGYLYAKFLIKGMPSTLSFIRRFFWQNRRQKLVILNRDKT